MSTKKLLVLLPIILVTSFFLLHSSTDQDNGFFPFVSKAGSQIRKAVDAFLQSKNFFQNPSFEDINSSTKTPNNWRQLGWQIDSNQQHLNKFSLSSVDLVSLNKHELSQTVIFPFTRGSKLRISFWAKSPFQSITINSIAFLNHPNTNQTIINLPTQTIKQDETWQHVQADLVIDQDSQSLRLDFNFVIDNKKPIYIDDFSLKLIPSD